MTTGAAAREQQAKQAKSAHRQVRRGAQRKGALLAVNEVSNPSRIPSRTIGASLAAWWTRVARTKVARKRVAASGREEGATRRLHLRAPREFPLLSESLFGWPPRVRASPLRHPASGESPPGRLLGIRHPAGCLPSGDAWQWDGGWAVLEGSQQSAWRSRPSRASSASRATRP